MIVGIFIFYTVPFLIRSDPAWRENIYTKFVLYSIAIAVVFFAIAAVAAIVSDLFSIVLMLTAAEWGTVIGFLCILVAILSITKILTIAGKTLLHILQLPWGPEPSGSGEDKK